MIEWVDSHTNVIIRKILHAVTFVHPEVNLGLNLSEV